MKKKLFGSHISPSCEYCSHNTKIDGDGSCSLNRQITPEGTCKKFRYNPLMRAPRSSPPLKKFDAEDFKL